MITITLTDDEAEGLAEYLVGTDDVGFRALAESIYADLRRHQP